ncbi:hypothetical protein ACQKKK_21650 [Peribacillus sp. NPDC006672]|uniref:hypothetical protein n=1 Tax=Peribacillus sp. NPDC006672 TaxID=3390606 RepID=UPI003CFC93C1
MNTLECKRSNPLYLPDETFAAVIIFSNITAYVRSAKSLHFIDCNGWFWVMKQKMQLPQFIGLGWMMAGITLLGVYLKDTRNSQVNFKTNLVNGVTILHLLYIDKIGLAYKSKYNLKKRSEINGRAFKGFI